MSDDYDDYEDGSDNIVNHPTATDIKMIEKVIEHPCEELFNLEPNSTTVMVPAPRSTELVQHHDYDEKDYELESNFQEIYDASMDAFDELQTGLHTLEGKYKARNSEVAMQMLNTALSAAREKARMKEHKDKLKQKSSGSNTIVAGNMNNNQINITASELIKMLANDKSPVNNHVEDVPEEGEVIEQKPQRTRKIRRKKTDSQETDQ